MYTPRCSDGLAHRGSCRAAHGNGHGQVVRRNQLVGGAEGSRERILRTRRSVGLLVRNLSQIDLPIRPTSRIPSRRCRRSDRGVFPPFRAEALCKLPTVTKAAFAPLAVALVKTLSSGSTGPRTTPTKGRRPDERFLAASSQPPWATEPNRATGTRLIGNWTGIRPRRPFSMPGRRCSPSGLYPGNRAPWSCYPLSSWTNPRSLTATWLRT